MDYRSAINGIAREHNTHRDGGFAQADIRRCAITTLAIIYQTRHSVVATDLAVAIHDVRNEPCRTTSK